jgi:hypothetical protein
MTLQELGGLGEFIAAIGIIFSLIYVGIEVRQSRKQALVEGVENRMSAWNEWSRLLLVNPDLRKTYLSGSRDLGSLEEDEQYVFHQLMTLRYTLLVRQFYRGKQLNDQEALDGAKGILLEQFSSEPSLADWWRQYRTEWRPGFREFVDAAVQEYDETLT